MYLMAQPTQLNNEFVLSVHSLSCTAQHRTKMNNRLTVIAVFEKIVPVVVIVLLSCLDLL